MKFDGDKPEHPPPVHLAILFKSTFLHLRTAMAPASTKYLRQRSSIPPSTNRIMDFYVPYLKTFSLHTPIEHNWIQIVFFPMIIVDYNVTRNSNTVLT